MFDEFGGNWRFLEGITFKKRLAEKAWVLKTLR